MEREIVNLNCLPLAAIDSFNLSLISTALLNTDSLVTQLKAEQEKNAELSQKLTSFNESALQIKSLYESEKRKNLARQEIETSYELKYNELMERFNTFSNETCNSELLYQQTINDLERRLELSREEYFQKCEVIVLQDSSCKTKQNVEAAKLALIKDGRPVPSSNGRVKKTKPMKLASDVPIKSTVSVTTQTTGDYLPITRSPTLSESSSDGFTFDNTDIDEPPRITNEELILETKQPEIATKKLSDAATNTEVHQKNTVGVNTSPSKCLSVGTNTELTDSKYSSPRTKPLSTTTRSTCTSAFIKKTDFGCNYPEYQPISVEEIFKQTIYDQKNLFDEISELADNPILLNNKACQTDGNEPVINRRSIGINTDAVKSKQKSNNSTRHLMLNHKDIVNPEVLLEKIKKEAIHSPFGSMYNLSNFQSINNEPENSSQLSQIWQLLGETIFTIMRNERSYQQSATDVTVINRNIEKIKELIAVEKQLDDAMQKLGKAEEYDWYPSSDECEDGREKDNGNQGRKATEVPEPCENQIPIPTFEPPIKDSLPSNINTPTIALRTDLEEIVPSNQAPPPLINLLDETVSEPSETIISAPTADCCTPPTVMDAETADNITTTQITAPALDSSISSAIEAPKVVITKRRSLRISKSSESEDTATESPPTSSRRKRSAQSIKLENSASSLPDTPKPKTTKLTNKRSRTVSSDCENNSLPTGPSSEDTSRLISDIENRSLEMTGIIRRSIQKTVPNPIKFLKAVQSSPTIKRARTRSECAGNSSPEPTNRIEETTKSPEPATEVTPTSEIFNEQPPTLESVPRTPESVSRTPEPPAAQSSTVKRTNPPSTDSDSAESKIPKNIEADLHELTQCVTFLSPLKATPKVKRKKSKKMKKGSPTELYQSFKLPSLIEPLDDLPFIDVLDTEIGNTEAVNYEIDVELFNDDFSHEIMNAETNDSHSSEVVESPQSPDCMAGLNDESFPLDIPLEREPDDDYDPDYSPLSPKPKDRYASSHLPTAIPLDHVSMVGDTSSLKMLNSLNTAIANVLRTYDVKKRASILQRSKKDTQIEAKTIVSLRTTIDTYLEEADWTSENLHKCCDKLVVRKGVKLKLLVTSILDVIEDNSGEEVNVALTPPAPPIPLTHQKMLLLIRTLSVYHIKSFERVVLFELDRKLFSLKPDTTRTDERKMEVLLSFTYLYIGLLDMTAGDTCQARIFIYKALYYNGFQAIPMIYLLLQVFPCVLPRKLHSEYDNSDPMISTLQTLLMASKNYVETNKKADSKYLNLYKKQNMLMLLQKFYGYVVNWPTQEELIKNLLGKLAVNKLENIDYCLILLAKRNGCEWALQKLITPHLYPMLNDLLSNTDPDAVTEAKIIVLISTIASIFKTFPNTHDCTAYMQLFTTILETAARPRIQEAAIEGLLKFQRFGSVEIFKRVHTWSPTFAVSRKTQIMLATFIHRKDFGFWKQLMNQIS